MKRNEIERFFFKYYQSIVLVIHSFQPLFPCSSPHRFLWHGSHPHLFCKLIQGYQQLHPFIRQPLGSRGSSSQRGHCRRFPLFKSLNEVHVNLLLHNKLWTYTRYVLKQGYSKLFWSRSTCELYTRSLVRINASKVPPNGPIRGAPRTPGSLG